jgi:alpha-tubulin suppressor-like RCC1 family protein
MAHTICKTTLKRVYSWGENKMGQLGHGHFHRVLSPKPIEFFNKHKVVICQVGVTAFGSVVLDINSKVWWFGSNGTIK